MTSTSFTSPQPELQNVAVVLDFTAGDFDRGFRIALSVYSNKELIGRKTLYSVPSAGKLPSLYEKWANSYSRLGHLNMADFTSVEGQVTNHAMLGECIASAKELRTYLKQWFNCPEFKLLSSRIQGREIVKQDRSVPVAFEFSIPNPEINVLLRKLPWHLWSLFTELSQAEVALSIGHQKNLDELEHKVRVLAIFGGDQETFDIQNELDSDKRSNTQKLSIQKDEEALRDVLQPLGATISFLEQPTSAQLQNALRDKGGWDLLFFSGHSTSSLDDGKLLINSANSISMSALRSELLIAIQNGLKLAIFNSCNGLGIANFFAGWDGESNFPESLARPSLIVMKEPVPDFVARRFFRAFLKPFTEGRPLYQAVREAREFLRILDENDTPYPCADWIPIVCLSPSQPELYWPLDEKKPRSHKVWKWVKRGGLAAAAASLAIGLGIGLINEGRDSSESAPIAVVSGDDYSLGEEFLLGESRNPVAQAGVNSFSQGDYDDAIRHFLTALKNNPNDPELLIYLQNAQAAISGKPITIIAVSIPGTDAEADAKELLRGVAQAQTEHNCGIEAVLQAVESPSALNCKVSATALQVMIADHENRNDVSKITNRFEDIVADPRISSLIGRYNSDMTFTVESNIVSEGIKIPVISTTSTAEREAGDAVSGYVFRTSPTDAATALKWHVYLESQGSQRIVVLSDAKSVYSQSLRNELHQLLPTAVKNQSYDCDLSNINACLTEIQGQSIDAIVLAPSDNQSMINAALNFVDRYGAANEDTPIILGGDTLYDSEQVLNRITQGSLLEQLLVAVPWHRSQTPTPFEEDALMLWRSQVNWRSAMAFDATKLLITAADQTVGSDDDDVEASREALRDAILANGLNDGATGNMQFSEDGNRIVESGDRVSVLVKVNLAERTYECIDGEACAE